MLTQYEELRVARGRTLALEHDTIEEDLGFLKTSFGVGRRKSQKGFFFLFIIIIFVMLNN